MSIKIKTDRTAAAWQDAQDALLVQMQVPLARFERNQPQANFRGRLMLRAASTEAMSLSSGSLVDIVEAYLRSAGSPDLRRDLAKMGRPQIVELAMSRTRLQRYFPQLAPRPAPGVALAQAAGDLPSLLADTLNKATSTLYAEARRSWRGWARRVEIADFKNRDVVRLKDFDNLPELPEGEPIGFHAVKEAGRETYRLATYARGVKITRKAMLNDDLALLRSIPVAFVQAAFRLEDALAYGRLEANP